jgi:hypothetical protein
MTTPTAWYAIFLFPIFVTGYLFGRFVLPNELRFPFPPLRVGRIMFVILTAFLVLRETLNAITAFATHTTWDFSKGIGAYADITVLTLALVIGYSKAPIRSASIKGSLAVAEDGGLQIVEAFVDPVKISLGEEKSKKVS